MAEDVVVDDALTWLAELLKDFLLFISTLDEASIVADVFEFFEVDSAREIFVGIEEHDSGHRRGRTDVLDDINNLCEFFL